MAIEKNSYWKSLSVINNIGTVKKMEEISFVRNVRMSINPIKLFISLWFTTDWLMGLNIKCKRRGGTYNTVIVPIIVVLYCNCKSFHFYNGLLLKKTPLRVFQSNTTPKCWLLNWIYWAEKPLLNFIIGFPCP